MENDISKDFCTIVCGNDDSNFDEEEMTFIKGFKLKEMTKNLIK